MIGQSQFAFTQLQQHPGGLVLPLIKEEDRLAKVVIGAEGKIAICAAVPRIPNFDQIRISVRHLDNTKKGFRAIALSVKNYSTGLWDLIGTATGDRDDTNPDFEPFFDLTGPAIAVEASKPEAPEDEDWCPATLSDPHKRDGGGRCVFCNDGVAELDLNLEEEIDNNDCPATLGGDHTFVCAHCGNKFA